MARIQVALVAAALLLPVAGRAATENKMGYTEVSQSDAQALPSKGGSLGMDIVQGQQIHDGGLNFELLKVKAVRNGTPGAQAGFKAGDQIIAADGHVFPALQAFAGYVRSLPPGTLMSVDYIPAGGGPQQAQRVGVTVGNGAKAVPPASAPADAEPARAGLSTGTKVAIGLGAAALFGCYEMGCFSHHQPVQRPPAPQQPMQQQPAQQ